MQRTVLRVAPVAMLVLDEPARLASVMGPGEALGRGQGDELRRVFFGCGIPECQSVSVVPERGTDMKLQHPHLIKDDGWTGKVSQREGEMKGPHKDRGCEGCMVPGRATDGKIHRL